MGFGQQDNSTIQNKGKLNNSKNKHKRRENGVNMRKREK
jgi:hypothetical protein